ncbi:MAG: DUF1570 domain-containing protein [Acidobacteria bacterium]|nr:DUF1570 domain-containing protein [Acidobacteriota bacterium]
MLALLLSVAGPTAAADKPEPWVEVRSPHFRVISNAGDKRARRAAGQFERFREVLRNTLVKGRLDSSMPMLIIAVKDEKGLKALLPEYWEKKGSMHPVGVFLRSLGKDFVILRLDVEGENPYHVIYHEYTHSLMALNFETLPIWVSEGLAEFFGNATIGDKEAGTGRASYQQIMMLRQNRLLPLATLLMVDRKSPYYNEADKTSLFYAQSWALTHYMMIGDNGVRQLQLMKYISLVADGIPDLEAARRAFGDLKQLENHLDEYVRQAMYYLPVKISGVSDEKQYTVRDVSEAEALAARGDFLLHNSRYTEARTMLDEALRLDPNQGLAHESLGFYHFRQGNREEAASHFAAAARLDSANYLAHYYYATLSPDLQDSTGTDSVEIHLRKAIELNPEFAPAYSALAGHYAMRGNKMEDALQLAIRAAQLEPGVLVHHINTALVLLRMNRAEEAVGIAQRALKAARTEEDRARIQSFLSEAARFQEYQAQKKRYEEETAAYRKQQEEDTARYEQEQKAAEEAARQQEAAAPKDSKPGKSPAGVARPAPQRSSVEGKVTEVTCGPPAAIYIALTAAGKFVTLHADNYFKIEFYSINWKPPDDFQPCRDLSGLTLKVTYNAVVGKPYIGEVLQVEVKK